MKLIIYLKYLLIYLVGGLVILYVTIPLSDTKTYFPNPIVLVISLISFLIFNIYCGNLFLKNVKNINRLKMYFIGIFYYITLIVIIGSYFSITDEINRSSRYPNVGFNWNFIFKDFSNMLRIPLLFSPIISGFFIVSSFFSYFKKRIAEH